MSSLIRRAAGRNRLVLLSRIGFGACLPVFRAQPEVEGCSWPAAVIVRQSEDGGSLWLDRNGCRKHGAAIRAARPPPGRELHSHPHARPPKPFPERRLG